MKLIRKHNELNLLKESDDFNWIRDVKPNISFYDVKVDEKYNVELSDDFYEALSQCFGNLTPGELMGYKRTTNVRVIDRGMMKHSDVYCYSGNDNDVISLHLAFYNDNGTDIADSFWVTEEMVNLYPRTTDLNESDDFDWVRDINTSDYLEPPYFINMKDEYGLSPDEYIPTLSKLFDQPVSIKGGSVYDTNGKEIYYEDSHGFWSKYEYDDQGNRIYYERSDGYWEKYEYDTNGNKIYYEDSDGFWIKREYNDQGDLIYIEDSNGYIEDNRHLNESNDFDWIKGVDISDYLEKPYFINMKEWGLKPNEYELVLSKVFNQPVTIEGGGIYDKEGNQIYVENSKGYWRKREYDDQGNEIYREDSNGHWEKYEYNDRGNLIYYETSGGYIEDNR